MASSTGNGAAGEQQGRAPWASRPRVDDALVKALARAFRWQRMLDDGVCGTIEELARRERVNRGYAARAGFPLECARQRLWRHRDASGR